MLFLSPCPPSKVNSIPSALWKMKCPKRGPRLLFYSTFYCIFSVLTRGITYDCFKLPAVQTCILGQGHAMPWGLSPQNNQHVSRWSPWNTVTNTSSDKRSSIWIYVTNDNWMGLEKYIPVKIPVRGWHRE